MCCHASRRLPPEPRSARDARRFLVECFTSWHLEGLLEDGQLALSELVTNGVVYGKTPLVVTISCAAGVSEIAVTDYNPALPVVRPLRRNMHADIDTANRRLGELAGSAGGAATADDRDPRLHVGEAGALTGGRGLLLLESLGEWGVAPHAGGKAVWVRMAVPSGWQAARHCACASDPAAVTLHSGHRAAHVG